MKLEPFVRIDSILFTASHEDIVRRYGPPSHEELTESGLTILDYGEMVFRFLGNGRLDEVSIQAKSLHLGQIIVPFQNLVGFVRLQDRNAFDRLGFTVSPRYGVAFIPYRRFWITALSRRAVLRWKGL